MKKRIIKMFYGAMSMVMFVSVLGPIIAMAETTGEWREEEGKLYWYENDIKQGYDENNPDYRGKEIYDPISGAWYWLDNVQGGAKAVSKDVYQESSAGKWGDYVGEDGQRYGKWVRYDENGHMIKGWEDTAEGRYFFDYMFGTMAKGYATIENVEYYFNPITGVLERTIGEVPENGWKNIDGVDYWYEDYTRQGYSVDMSYRGKEIYDPISGAWYWLDNVQGGAKAVSKDVYQESLANDAGNIGKWVRYDENGHMVKGWSGEYYFNPTYGTMAKGIVTIENKNYKFDEETGVCIGEVESSDSAEEEGNTGKKTYVEENGLEFYKETSFTTQGYRYNSEDPSSTNESIDVEVSILDITIEDSENEGYQVVTIRTASSGYVTYNETSISVPGSSICDMYTGKVIPSASIRDEALLKSNMEIEWEGKKYTVSSTKSVSWEWNDWTWQKISEDVIAISSLGTCYSTSILEVPKGYDGLVLLVSPAQYSENEDSGVSGSVEIERDSETYIMDIYEDGSYLINVIEAYNTLAGK